MAETDPTKEAPLPEESVKDNAGAAQGGAYEIIQRRLQAHASELQQRLNKLNVARREVFGAVETKLTGTERVLTNNNCVPRDMVTLGNRLLFGYNVQLGLRKEMTLSDVFAVYEQGEMGFVEQSLTLIEDAAFARDFQELYRYYRNTRFVKFAEIGPHLFMVFRVGRTIEDVKTFKWLMQDDGALVYLDNRSDHEYRFPPQHEFEWIKATRDLHRSGAFPHVSIQDRIFVETTGGDLTIKVEDNTATGEGIYQEPVDDPDQILDDADIFYANVGNLILMKIKPYREERYRYIVYSEKVQEARRMDAIAGACVLLPEDHGIIFSNGYYLQTGEYKAFDSGLKDMLFDRRIASPNGEDHLFVFYNRDTGTYVLLSYNVIEQRVENPIECHGYCLFEDGRLLYFKSQEEPSKSHVIQIWQTPYTSCADAVSDRRDHLLFKVGNRDIVRCMAACRTLMGLLQREDSYANLYLDISRQATDLLDCFFWIREPDAYDLGAPLTDIQAAAAAAIDEFERVVQLRAAAAGQLEEAETESRELLNRIRLERHEHIQAHVKTLGALRGLRGRIIGLRDVRYMDMDRVQALEDGVQQQYERQARSCVEFLLQAEAMQPYQVRIAELAKRIEAIGKVRDGEALREEVDTISGELEMLIEIVSNLKIDDATQRTAITDTISSLFGTLNQSRAALQNKVRSLASVEGAAEFGAQMKLLSQAVINYLDVCDTPVKCEQYLSRVMIQVEELEGQFVDFDDYLVKLAEKREEIYNAFESRRLSLVEARNKRADTLMQNATRILNSIRSRADTLKTVEDMHGYFAADLMIERLRGIAAQLVELDDPVKADDIQTRLKSLREDAVRQLHDRQELFVGGENVIKFGRHQFSVNVQALDLTLVPRGDDMTLHLTGTNFFEPVTDETFLATRPVWEQELVSENEDVYRAEYLAFCMLTAADALGTEPSVAELAKAPAAEVLEHVRTCAAPRYAEGYQKGVHDEDAARLLKALAEIQTHIGLLRHPSPARSLAMVYWKALSTAPDFAQWKARLTGFGASNRLFRQSRRYAGVIAELTGRIEAFAAETGLFDGAETAEAAEYVFGVVAGDGAHPIHPEAAKVVEGFYGHLQKLGGEAAFADARAQVGDDVRTHYSLVREWVNGFLEAKTLDRLRPYLDEAAALMFVEAYDAGRVSDVKVAQALKGLRGSHARIQNGEYALNYNTFMPRLRAYVGTVVPRFEQYARLKKEWLDRNRRAMRLDEFKPRVLTSFVRNRLIDRVYLPLVGDNLAKQIGTVGHTTRTDRSGMLLLISPPGYGKTTLMEYVANRMGLVFMKINGPAIGHQVTSLDPSEAPNAAAREELHKLGLALEMGDNVMLYVDDIQHCHAEFLQKFISLCDAQRKIEGVYKGQTRTYDMRGKKVAVVMAGNPYTESGEKFRIPDMLANRADTYNLGDILGDYAEPFELSFLENALTSNPVLHKLASGSRNDIHAVIRIASTDSRDGVELEGRYAAEELNEIVAVMKKMLRIRDVVLRVNEEYIRSAGQADEFRTEPAFRLQGSYRNMNRLAAKVEAVMNDAELETLIYSEYENEAQTLTTGAEANLLKFKEILGLLKPQEAERWAEIKSTYKRNQLMRGVDADDPAGQAVMQLAGLGQGLADIRDILEDVGRRDPGPIEAGLSDRTMDRIAAILEQARADQQASGLTPALARMLEQQFERLQECVRADAKSSYRKRLDRLSEQVESYEHLRTHCRKWRDEFLSPLKQQCEGKTVASPLYVTHLDQIIEEVNQCLKE